MNQRVLLTGATGYVGGRMRRQLEELGVPLRCLARRPEELRARVPETTEVVRGDLLEPETLGPALQDVHTAYYLVHSMGSGDDFEKRDRAAAENFRDAAAAAGVQRIIYLGGLAHDADLSPHLRSRLEVGEILRSGPVCTIELQASIVLGSGSLSFEMVRALVERLPVMICPKWVDVEAQPIATEDLLAYLIEALELQQSESRVFEIGGAERVSYGDLMREYARQRGLKRLMIRVPVLTPRLSSLWLGLVTPIYARVGSKLIESVKHPTVVHDTAALDVFQVRPRGIAQAMADALSDEERKITESRWYDAFSSSGLGQPLAGARFGNRLVDQRAGDVSVNASAALAPIRRIGGETGWYGFDWLWKLRGFLDLLVGGVGVRRGRPHPDKLQVGDALDFWRVEAYEPDRLLRLRAEMKLPGRAWLEFEVLPTETGASIRQTALFDPIGLRGLLYWWAIYPLHVLIFRRMLRNICRAAEAAAS